MIERQLLFQIAIVGFSEDNTLSYLTMIGLIPNVCDVTDHVKITTSHESFLLHVNYFTIMFLPYMFQ